MTDEERREVRRAAEDAGYRPGEVCGCREPKVIDVSGRIDGRWYFLHRVCGTCRRRARP